MQGILCGVHQYMSCEVMSNMAFLNFALVWKFPFILKLGFDTDIWMTSTIKYC